MLVTCYAKNRRSATIANARVWRTFIDTFLTSCKSCIAPEGLLGRVVSDVAWDGFRARVGVALIRKVWSNPSFRTSLGTVFDLV